MIKLYASKWVQGVVTLFFKTEKANEDFVTCYAPQGSLNT